MTQRSFLPDDRACRRYGRKVVAEATANEFICTSHFACFDLETGRQIDGPGYDRLTRFDVRIADGEALVARTPKLD